MELAEEARGIGDVGGRFPGVVRGAVALPGDQVLELTAVPPGVEDGVDLPFFLVVDDDGWRWWRETTGYGVGMVGLEEGDMEDAVEAGVGPEVEAVCTISYFCNDRKRA